MAKQSVAENSTVSPADQLFDYAVGLVRADAARLALSDAAPELLAALKAMVSLYDGVRDMLTCERVIAKLAAADAAIAKAEGAR